MREAAKKKNVFFLEIKCGWKIAFFDPNFTFCFPKSHKNPGVGGWVNRFGKGFPKKDVFFWDTFPKASTFYSVIFTIEMQSSTTSDIK